MGQADDVNGWVRTAEGWAINLDGSDARTGFSLPRLEIRSSSQGWQSLWFASDGNRRELPPGSSPTMAAAKAAARQLAGLPI